MSRYGSVTISSGSSLLTRVVQSSSPDDLAARVNREISLLPAGYEVIGLSLAGAGDGDFEVLIEAGALVDILNGGFAVAPSVACYLASTSAAALTAHAAALPGSGVVADSQIAGSSQGPRTVFMGMIVSGSLGGLNGLPDVLAVNNTTGAHDIIVNSGQALRGTSAAGGSGLPGSNLELEPGLGDGAGANGIIYTLRSLYAGTSVASGEPDGSIVAVSSAATTPRGVISWQHSDDANSAHIVGIKTRGTRSAQLAVQSGDRIARFLARGYDGTSYIGSGVISFDVDAAVASGSVPQAFLVLTGTTNTPTERLRISSVGAITGTGGTTGAAGQAVVFTAGAGTATPGAISLTGGATTVAGNAGAATLAGGTATSGIGGVASLLGGTGGGALGNNSAGGSAIVQGGTSTGNAAGGPAYLIGGTGGVGNGGAGGATSVLGGNHGASGGDGGDVLIQGGLASTLGNYQGGDVTIVGGLSQSGVIGGSIFLNAGNVTSGGFSGGGITGTGGTGAPTNGVGGAVLWQGGAGQSSGAGGNATVLGGTAGVTALGGIATLQGGQGGATTGAGGAALVLGGTGGPIGAGGAATLQGGQAGATSGDGGTASVLGGTPVEGNGGSVVIAGAAGVGTTRNGGSVTLTPGAPTGAGTAGSVDLRDSGGTTRLRVALSNTMIGTTTSLQSMVGGLFFGNSAAAPTGNPTSGVYLYATAGALIARGSGGTITTVAAA